MTRTAPPLDYAEFARYETPAASHRLLGLSCTGFGYAPCKRYPFGPRTLGSYAAVFVTKGSGWLETSATTGRLPVQSGMLFWLFPTVTHTYSPDGHGWAEQWVLFEGPLAETFESLGFISPAHPVVRVGQAPEIATLFAQLNVDVTEGGPLAGVLAAALVYRLVIVAHHIGSGLEANDSPALNLKLAMARLEERALQPLDIADIARECHLGYSTFRRHFKLATGYSPKEYVLRVRLRAAKQLLAFTNQSVADVAAAVGFDDAFYFSRLFRTKEGLSPTLFRQQQGVNGG